jgi:polyhydroxyalkanoate synthesis regulator phasin
MKKIHTIIVASVVVTGIVLSGLAFADSQGKGHRQGFGYKKRHLSALMLLARYQQKNLMIQVLSELTGQKTEAISTKLKEQRIHTVMQGLDIDRQAFLSAMQTKISNRVKQAVAEGSITPEQEKEILAKMENLSKRREVMSKLIEKGIADGTITKEEAQMLRPKRR